MSKNVLVIPNTFKTFKYEDLFKHKSNPFNNPTNTLFTGKEMQAYASYCKDCIVIGNHPLNPYEWRISQQVISNQN